MHPQEAGKHLSLAERCAALSRISTTLMSELDETRLHQLIVETACQLTHATFAAFSIRPTNEAGQLVGSSEGSLFHLAAVVGVTNEQKALFRRMPLGGEGLLSPIFRHGISVLVPDALAHPAHSTEKQTTHVREPAMEVEYTQEQLSLHGLRSMRVPHGHPLIRSFLGAPLLDREKQVRGGLLLGHTDPNRFTPEDEALLVGLAAQAAVALENARLYRAVQTYAQELDAIFETIVDGVTLIDLQGCIRRENGTARRLREHLQASPEGERAIEEHLYGPARHAVKDEAVHNTPISVPDSRNETREYTVKASPITSLSCLLQQDEHRDSHVSKVVSGAVVIWHDVTEAHRLLLERRIHAETEARRALLQLIIDELPSSVYLVQGQDARLVLANNAAITLWGVPWSIGEPMPEFLARNGIRIFGVDGRALEASQLATIRTIQTGETIRQHQEIIRHADGTMLPVQVNAVPLPLSTLTLSFSEGKNHPTQETALAALVVHQDVTALKEVELVKDDFIGLAAHELRTPLAVLKGFAQTLIVQTARGKGPELAEWQSEALQEIDQATTRLADLLEDLLDITRLQAGQLELHIEPIDVIAYVQRLITRIQMTTERHQLCLHTTLSHLVVSVDARRIEQILTNMLSNAIKFSPTGGFIEVTIQHDKQKTLGLVCIRDHGIGIPASQQAHIFGRFARADNAQAYGIGGTGLGLYLCRELVERQGGRIWFESVEGKGSTFWIALPLLSNTPPLC